MAHNSRIRKPRNWSRPEDVESLQAQAAVLRAKQAELAAAIDRATVVVLDAQQERDHWRRAAGAAINECQVMVAVLMRRLGEERIVVTPSDVERVRHLELLTSDPEPNFKIYQIRERSDEPAAGR